MLTVAVPKRNKLQNIIVLTPKDGYGEWTGKNKRKNLKKGLKIFLGHIIISLTR